ncbi:MAG TPA: hypothetical protein VF880_10385 [Actinomycetes bacterium]
MTGEQLDGLPITEEEFERWYEATRQRRGLPLTIEDPALLDRLVTLAFAGRDDAGPAAARRRQGAMNRKQRNARKARSRDAATS